jgi:hypothetical protein
MARWADASLGERARRIRDPYWWLYRLRGPFAAYHRRFAELGLQVGCRKVVFLIKLVGQADTADWHAVRDRLCLTLDAISRQRGAEISVVICGQDLPNDVSCEHEIRFVAAPARLPRIDGIDKQAKHRLGARALVDFWDEPAYVVMLDADDIPHPDLVHYVTSDDNGRGYLIDDGYMWDVDRCNVVRLSGPITGMRFDEMCGSCAVIAVDLRRKRLAKRVLCTLPMNHKVIGSHMAALGQPLEPIPFPAMIYSVNHADNASSRFGRDRARQGLFDRFSLGEADSKRALQEFGLLPYNDRNQNAPVS